jgi:hypothetical protein
MWPCALRLRAPRACNSRVVGGGDVYVCICMCGVQPGSAARLYRSTATTTPPRSCGWAGQEGAGKPSGGQGRGCSPEEVWVWVLYHYICGRRGGTACNLIEMRRCGGSMYRIG